MSSKAEQFLRYMADRQWHSNGELMYRFGTSYNQRKNEMQRDGGIRFERRSGDEPGLWYYRLATPPNEIDFEHLCLKIRSQYANEDGQMEIA